MCIKAARPKPQNSPVERTTTHSGTNWRQTDLHRHTASQCRAVEYPAPLVAVALPVDGAGSSHVNTHRGDYTLHTVAVEANIEPVHPHAGHSSDRKRCPGGPHTCEHQRTHAGLSSTRQWPPTACTPSLAAALVGAPQQRLASAKSAASTKLWKRPGLPPGMRQHSPCDHPPTCRQQWSALTSPTAWHHDRWSRR